MVSIAYCNTIEICILLIVLINKLVFLENYFNLKTYFYEYENKTKLLPVIYLHSYCFDVLI